MPQPASAQPPAPGPDRATRASIYALALFYALVAFEFFYMATPFALYLYGAYLPALGTLSAIPGAQDLSSFFLPHYVTASSSVIVRWHEVAGIALFLAGLCAFALAAGQVYHAKLTRRGAVTGGIYRFIRHPQYAALAVGGLGLLLLWPRFLVLILFVTMLFAYAWLARVEERECERKFGNQYRVYLVQTGGFVPRKLEWLGKPALYGVALLAAIGAGTLLRAQTVSSLQALYVDRAAFVAVTDTAPETLDRVVRIVGSDPEIRTRLGVENYRYINYVLPSAWYVPEIPMNPPAGVDCHNTPTTYDRERYRVVFTRADLGERHEAMGREIVTSARARSPMLEAEVDLRQGRVVGLEEPKAAAYQGVPVPVL